MTTQDITAFIENGIGHPMEGILDVMRDVRGSVR
jgi:hypothetical protein